MQKYFFTDLPVLFLLIPLQETNNFFFRPKYKALRSACDVLVVLMVLANCIPNQKHLASTMQGFKPWDPGSPSANGLKGQVLVDVGLTSWCDCHP